MKLLIVTQVVDQYDPVLGFFCRWIEKFAQQCEQVIVIGLRVGDYRLPANVQVLSLGKESGHSRWKYLGRLGRYLWRERQHYDTVLVHMNQEYVLLAGWLWCLQGKKVAMWRNHHAGSWLTDVAAWFCDKIFCTSKFSYAAKYRQTVLMPVGIDRTLFKPNLSIQKKSNSILFLARMSPVKRPDVLLIALEKLKQQGEVFTADFYGAPLPLDSDYYQRLKTYVATNNLSRQVRFHGAVTHEAIVSIYHRAHIFVNLSPSGMYDKTIFEAAACGALPLSSNINLQGEIDKRLLFREADPVDLAQQLKVLLSLTPAEAEVLQHQVEHYVESKHSLDLLAKKLTYELVQI